MNSLNNPKDLKEQKSSHIFRNLKGTFFLQKMFDNIHKKKYLKMIKYNKDLKKE